MREANFVERRREYRLPFHEKIVFTTGSETFTAYTINISRGGLFVTSLDPFPIDTAGFLAFFLPNQPKAICVKSKVVHIVFDRQRCEVECGMGFQFMELNETQKSLLNVHIIDEQSNYLELKKLLGSPTLDSQELSRCLKKIPSLESLDLLELRYRVNRVCTIFEPAPDPFEDDEKSPAA